MGEKPAMRIFDTLLAWLITVIYAVLIVGFFAALIVPPIVLIFGWY